MASLRTLSQTADKYLTIDPKAVVTSWRYLRLFFSPRKVGCALANTMLAIVIAYQTLPGRLIVFASSTDYYPPGKQKQKNSLAEFL
jgi:hypothetical protein